MHATRITCANILLLIGFGLIFFAFDSAVASNALVLGAIGDSITVACNAVNVGDNPALSWSSGTDSRVNSHLKRLGAYLKTDVQGINLAVTGAKVSDLSPQVENMAVHKPDYLTIEIGANDLCSWKDDYPAKILQFSVELRKHVEKIVEANPKVKILLASIPDLYGLWEVGSRRSECQMRWDVLGICAPMLSSRTTTQERAAFVERWRTVNGAIAAVAERYPENAIFNGGVGSARIAREHVSSIDCFHPSVEGQNFLAEKAWPFMQKLTHH